MEIRRWKVMFQLLPPEDRPDTLVKAMKECDQQRFPNLHGLLRIVCTLPVPSCERERSASALRRLMNYMRSSIGAERQANLALISCPHTHPL